MSPNYEHLKYAKQWIEAFPDAHAYACPGLRAKKPELAFTDTIGVEGQTPAAWPAEIEYAFFDCETTPVLGTY